MPIRPTPALRISNIVHGRQNDDGRVTYLVDPFGRGAVRGIPEIVVLKRWKRRQNQSVVFDGCRLSPTAWRAIRDMFALPWQEVCKLDEEVLEFAVIRYRQNRVRYGSPPAAHHLKYLLTALGPNRLQTIIERHIEREQSGRYGTPDLFLYATDRSSRTLAYCRFVEVKKPREAISDDQKEEIEFLRSIGLHARVLRLIERS